MNYIAIDPGLSGAVAILRDDGGVVLIDTPTAKIKSGKKTKRVYIEKLMVDIFTGDYSPSNTHVGIENIHSMPGQGVSSMFTMGFGFGLWRGIIVALGYPYTKITPQRWKKDTMDGMGKEKAASCVRAQQLYPDAELFTPRGRALDGRGDALLMATYLKKTHHMGVV